MKAKHLKKLSVKKQTVANLEAKQMKNARGGKEIRSLLNDCETDLVCWTLPMSCPEQCWS